MKDGSFSLNQIKNGAYQLDDKWIDTVLGRLDYTNPDNVRLSSAIENARKNKTFNVAVAGRDRESGVFGITPIFFEESR